MVWSTMNVITTCNYRFQEVLYLINVRVRVRTGSSIGLPLATVYCGLNTNTYNELFTSWDVNYCTHNFWNRLQHAIVQWISSYIQDVEKISVIYRGYRNLTSLSFGWMYILRHAIVQWISSYIQDVEKISVIYKGYRNLTSLACHLDECI